MKLLAIDTSTETASAALLVGKELFCEEQKNQKTHAQFILPMIDSLMSQAGLQINQLDAIVFGRGPGSFTGLRIACSIAKGLAFAHDIPLMPVSSLLAIVWSIRKQYNQDLPVLAILDARMHEIYWAYFPENKWTAEEYVTSVSQVNIPEQTVILAGSGIDIYWDDFTPEIKTRISEKVPMLPSAASMIQYAQFSGQAPILAAHAQPVYVRNKVT